MPDRDDKARKAALGRERYERLKAGEKLAPEEYASEALHRRVQDEATPVDPAVLERFKAAHDGMTPIQWAISQHPSVQKDIEKNLPHVLPPKGRRGKP